eukprot:Rmarinus@m.901
MDGRGAQQNVEAPGIQSMQEPESHYVLPVPTPNRPGRAAGRQADYPAYARPAPLPRPRQGPAGTRDPRKRPWWYMLAWLVFFFGYSCMILWANTVILSDYYGITYENESGDLSVEGYLYAENVAAKENAYMGRHYSDTGSLQLISSSNTIMSQSSIDLTIQAAPGREIVFENLLDLGENSIQIGNMQFSGEDGGSITAVGDTSFEISASRDLYIDAGSDIEVAAVGDGTSVEFETAESGSVSLEGTLTTGLGTTSKKSLLFDGTSISGLQNEDVAFVTDGSVSLEASSVTLNYLTVGEGGLRRDGTGYLHLDAPEGDADVSIRAGYLSTADGSVIFSDGDDEYLSFDGSSVTAPNGLQVKSSDTLSLSAQDLLVVSDTEVSIESADAVSVYSEHGIQAGGLSITSHQLIVQDSSESLVLAADSVSFTSADGTFADTENAVQILGDLSVNSGVSISSSGSSMTFEGDAAFSANNALFVQAAEDVTVSASSDAVEIRSVGDEVVFTSTGGVDAGWSMTVGDDTSVAADSVLMTSAGGDLSVTSSDDIDLSATAEAHISSLKGKVSVDAGSGPFSATWETDALVSGTEVSISSEDDVSVTAGGKFGLAVSAQNDVSGNSMLSVSATDGLSIDGTGDVAVRSISAGVGISSGMSDFVLGNNDVAVYAEDVVVSSSAGTTSLERGGETATIAVSEAEVSLTTTGDLAIDSSRDLVSSSASFSLTSTGDASIASDSTIAVDSGSFEVSAGESLSVNTKNLNAHINAEGNSVGVSATSAAISADSSISVQSAGATILNAGSGSVSFSSDKEATFAAEDGSLIISDFDSFDVTSGGETSVSANIHVAVDATDSITVATTRGGISHDNDGSIDLVSSGDFTATAGTVTVAGGAEVATFSDEDVAITARAFHGEADQISINADEISIATGSMNVEAETLTVISGSASVTADAGDISVSAGATEIVADSVEAVATLGDVELSAEETVSVTAGADVSVTSSAGPVTFAAPKGEVDVRSTAGNVVLTASDDVEVTGKELEVSALTTVSLAAAGSVDLSGGSGDVEVSASDVMVDADVLVTLAAGGKSVSVESRAATVSVSSAERALSASGASAHFAANDAVDVTSTGATTLTALNGDLSVDSATASVTVTAGTGAGGAFTVNAGEVSASALSDVDLSADSILMEAGNDVQVEAADIASVSVESFEVESGSAHVEGSANTTFTATTFVTESGESTSLAGETMAMIDARSGRVRVVSARDVNPSVHTAADGAGDGSISVSAGTSVRMQADAGVSVSAPEVNLSGSGVRVDSDFDASVDADTVTVNAADGVDVASSKGGVVLSTSDGVEAGAGQIRVHADDQVTITSAGSASVDASTLSTSFSADGQMLVDADAAIDVTAGGSVSVTATNDVTVTAATAATVDAAEGASVEAGTVLTVSGSDVSIDAGSGDVELEATEGGLFVNANSFTFTSSDSFLGNNDGDLLMMTSGKPLEAVSRTGDIAVTAAGQFMANATDSSISVESSDSQVTFQTLTGDIVANAGSDIVLSAASVSLTPSEAAGSGDIVVGALDTISVVAGDSLSVHSREAAVEVSADSGNFVVSADSVVETGRVVTERVSGEYHASATDSASLIVPERGNIVLSDTGASLFVEGQQGMTASTMNATISVSSTDGTLMASSDDVSMEAGRDVNVDATTVTLSAGMAAFVAEDGNGRFVSDAAVGIVSGSKSPDEEAGLVLIDAEGSVAVEAMGDQVLLDANNVVVTAEVASVELMSGKADVSIDADNVGVSARDGAVFTSQEGAIVFQTSTNDVDASAGTVVIDAANDVFMNGTSGVNLRTDELDITMTASAGRVDVTAGDEVQINAGDSVTVEAGVDVVIDGVSAGVGIRAGLDDFATAGVGSVVIESANRQTFVAGTDVDVAASTVSVNVANGDLDAEAGNDASVYAGNVGAINVASGNAEFSASVDAFVSGANSVLVTAADDAHLTAPSSIAMTSIGGGAGRVHIDDSSITIDNSGSGEVFVEAPVAVELNAENVMDIGASSLSLESRSGSVDLHSQNAAWTLTADDVTVTAAGVDAETAITVEAAAGGIEVTATGISVVAENDVSVGAGDADNAGRFIVDASTGRMESALGTAEIEAVGGDPTQGGISLLAATSDASVAPSPAAGSVAFRADDAAVVAADNSVEIVSDSVSIAAGTSSTFTAAVDVNIDAETSDVSVDSSLGTSLHAEDSVAFRAGETPVAATAGNVHVESDSQVHLRSTNAFSITAQDSAVFVAESSVADGEPIMNMMSSSGDVVATATTVNVAAGRDAMMTADGDVVITAPTTTIRGDSGVYIATGDGRMDAAGEADPADGMFDVRASGTAAFTAGTTATITAESGDFTAAAGNDAHANAALDITFDSVTEDVTVKSTGSGVEIDATGAMDVDGGVEHVTVEASAQVNVHGGSVSLTTGAASPSVTASNVNVATDSSLSVSAGENVDMSAADVASISTETMTVSAHMSAEVGADNDLTLTTGDTARFEAVKATLEIAITRARIQSNVVTITTALPHNLKAGNRAVIAGASQVYPNNAAFTVTSAYNGNHIVTDVPNDTQFRFPLTGNNGDLTSAVGQLGSFQYHPRALIETEKASFRFGRDVQLEAATNTTAFNVDDSFVASTSHGAKFESDDSLTLNSGAAVTMDATAAGVVSGARSVHVAAGPIAVANAAPAAEDTVSIDADGTVTFQAAANLNVEVEGDVALTSTSGDVTASANAIGIFAGVAAIDAVDYEIAAGNSLVIADAEVDVDAGDTVEVEGTNTISIDTVNAGFHAGADATVDAADLNAVAAADGVQIYSEADGVGFFAGVAESDVAPGNVLFDAAGDVEFSSEDDSELESETEIRMASSNVRLDAAQTATATADMVVSMSAPTVDLSAETVDVFASVGDFESTVENGLSLSATNQLTVTNTLSDVRLTSGDMLTVESTAGSITLDAGGKVTLTSSNSDVDIDVTNGIVVDVVGDAGYVPSNGLVIEANSGAPSGWVAAERGDFAISVEDHLLVEAEVGSIVYEHENLGLDVDAGTLSVTASGSSVDISASGAASFTAQSVLVDAAADITLAAVDGITVEADEGILLSTSAVATAAGNLVVEGTEMTFETDAASVAAGNDMFVQSETGFRAVATSSIALDSDTAQTSLIASDNVLVSTEQGDMEFFSSDETVIASSSAGTAGSIEITTGASALDVGYTLLEGDIGVIATEELNLAALDPSGAGQSATHLLADSALIDVDENLEISTYWSDDRTAESVSISGATVEVETAGDIALTASGPTLGNVVLAADNSVVLDVLSSQTTVSYDNGAGEVQVTSSPMELHVIVDGDDGIDLTTEESEILVNANAEDINVVATDGSFKLAVSSSGTDSSMSFGVSGDYMQVSAVYGLEVQASVMDITSTGGDFTMNAKTELQLTGAVGVGVDSIEAMSFTGNTVTVTQDADCTLGDGGDCPDMTFALITENEGADLILDTPTDDYETVIDGHVRLVDLSKTDGRFETPDALTECRNGEIRWDSDAIYLCVDEDDAQEKWMQVPLDSLEQDDGSEAIVAELQFDLSPDEIENMQAFVDDFETMLETELDLSEGQASVTSVEDDTGAVLYPESARRRHLSQTDDFVSGGYVHVKFQVTPEESSTVASSAALTKSALTQLVQAAEADSCSPSCTSTLLTFRQTGTQPRRLNAPVSLGGTDASLSATTNALPTITMTSTNEWVLISKNPISRSFTLSDAEDDVEDLSVSVTSSEQLLINNANITLVDNGNGAYSFTMLMEPTDDLVTTITVRVEDTAGGVSKATYTVSSYSSADNTAPYFESAIQDTTVNEDPGVLTGFSVVIRDGEGVGGAKDLSSNLLIHAEYEMLESDPYTMDNRDLGLHFEFHGTSAERTVDITIADDVFGQAKVTLIVEDSAGSLGTDTFTLTVLSVVDGPTVTSIDDRQFYEDQISGSVYFSVTNPEEVPAYHDFVIDTTDLTNFPEEIIVFDKSQVIVIPDLTTAFEDLTAFTSGIRGYSFVVRCPYGGTYDWTQPHTPSTSYSADTTICQDAVDDSRLMTEGLYVPDYDIDVAQDSNTVDDPDSFDLFAWSLEAGDLLLIDTDDDGAADEEHTILSVTKGADGSFVLSGDVAAAGATIPAGSWWISRARDRTFLVMKNNNDPADDDSYNIYRRDVMLVNPYASGSDLIAIVATDEITKDTTDSTPLKTLTVSGDAATAVMDVIEVGDSVQVFHPSNGQFDVTGGSNLLVPGSTTPTKAILQELKPRDRILVNGEVRNITAIDTVNREITVDQTFLNDATDKAWFYSQEVRTVVAIDTDNMQVTLDYPMTKEVSGARMLFTRPSLFTVLKETGTTETADTCFSSPNDISRLTNRVYEATCTDISTSVFASYPTGVSVAVRCPTGCLSEVNLDGNAQIQTEVVTGSSVVTLSSSGKVATITPFAITMASASGGIATVTAEHDFETGDSVTIQGVEFFFSPDLDDTFNGKHTVTVLSSTQFTFPFTTAFEDNVVDTHGTCYSLKGVVVDDALVLQSGGSTYTRKILSISGNALTLQNAIVVSTGSYEYQFASLKTLVSVDGSAVFENITAGYYLHIDSLPTKKVSSVTDGTRLTLASAYSTTVSATDFRYSVVTVVGAVLSDSGDSEGTYVFEQGSSICSAALYAGVYEDDEADDFLRTFIYTSQISLSASASVGDQSDTSLTGYIIPAAADGGKEGFFVKSGWDNEYEDRTPPFVDDVYVHLTQTQLLGSPYFVTCPATDCSVEASIDYFLLESKSATQLNRVVLTTLDIAVMIYNSGAGNILIKTSVPHNLVDGSVIQLDNVLNPEICRDDWDGGIVTDCRVIDVQNTTYSILTGSSCVIGEDNPANPGYCSDQEFEITNIPEPTGYIGGRSEIDADSYGNLGNYLTADDIEAGDIIYGPSLTEIAEVLWVFDEEIVLTEPLPSVITASGFGVAPIRLSGTNAAGYSADSSICQAAWREGLITDETAPSSNRTVMVSFIKTTGVDASISPPYKSTEDNQRGFVLSATNLEDPQTTLDSQFWVLEDGTDRRMDIDIPDNVHGDVLVTVEVTDTLDTTVTETFRISAESRADGLTMISDGPSGNELDEECTAMNEQCLLPFELVYLMIDTDGSESISAIEFVTESCDYSIVTDETNVFAATEDASTGECVASVTNPDDYAAWAILPPKHFPIGEYYNLEFQVDIRGRTVEADTLHKAVSDSWESVFAVTAVADGPLITGVAVEGQENDYGDFELDLALDVTYEPIDSDGSEYVLEPTTVSEVPYGTLLLETSSLTAYPAEAALAVCSNFDGIYIDWSTDDNACVYDATEGIMSDDDEGAVYYIRCPAGCAAEATDIYGDLFYTDDSPVCKAAVHAGIYDDDVGGLVRIHKRLGSQYTPALNPASTHNGVTSQAYKTNYVNGLAFIPDTVDFVDEYAVTRIEVPADDQTVFNVYVDSYVWFEAGAKVSLYYFDGLIDSITAAITPAVDDTTQDDENVYTVDAVADDGTYFTITHKLGFNPGPGDLTTDGSTPATGFASTMQLMCQSHVLTVTNVTEPAKMRFTEHGVFTIDIEGTTQEDGSDSTATLTGQEVITVRPFSDEPLLTIGSDDSELASIDTVIDKSGNVDGLTDTFVELGDTWVQLTDNLEVIGGLTVSGLPSGSHLYLDTDQDSTYERLCPSVRLQGITIDIVNNAAVFDVAVNSYIIDGETLTVSGTSSLLYSDGSSLGSIDDTYTVIGDAGDSDSTTWEVDITAKGWLVDGVVTGGKFGTVHCGVLTDAVYETGGIVTFDIPRDLSVHCYSEDTISLTDISDCRTADVAATHLSRRVVYPRLALAIKFQPEETVVLEYSAYSIEPLTCEDESITRACDIYSTRRQEQEVTLYLWNAPPVVTFNDPLLLAEDGQETDVTGYQNSVPVTIDGIDYVLYPQAISVASAGSVYEDSFQYSDFEYSASCVTGVDTNADGMEADQLLVEVASNQHNPLVVFFSNFTGDMYFRLIEDAADGGEDVTCTLSITDNGLDAYGGQAVNGPQTGDSDFIVKVLPVPDPPIFNAVPVEMVVVEGETELMQDLNPTTSISLDNEEVSHVQFRNFGNAYFTYGGGATVSNTDFVLIQSQYKNNLIFNAENYNDTDFTLSIRAYTEQNGRPDVYQSGEWAEIPIRVLAKADAPSVTGEDLTADEDAVVDLDITPSLADTDGSESLNLLELDGLPIGTIISLNGVDFPEDGSGTAFITPTSGAFLDDVLIANLTMDLPPDWDEDFPISVRVQSEEGETDTDQYLSGFKSAWSPVATILVTINPVADKPVVVPEDATGGEDSLVPLTVTPIFGNTEGSEEFLEMIVTNLPTGAEIRYDSVTYTGSPITLPPDNFVNNVPLSELYAKPAVNDVSDFTLTWKVVVEVPSTGETAASDEEPMNIFLSAQADVPTISATDPTPDYEETCFELDIHGGATDPSETVIYELTLVDHTGDDAYAVESEVEVWTGTGCVDGVDTRITPVDGVWTIPEDPDVTTVYARVSDHLDKDIDFTWTVTAVDGSDSSTVSVTFLVEVLPLASPITLDYADPSGLETNLISVSMTPFLQDTDGSESMTQLVCTITGSTGVEMNFGTFFGTNTMTVAQTFPDGEMLEDFTVQPFDKCDVDFVMNVAMTTTDGEGDEEDTGVTDTPITVSVIADADRPLLSGTILAAVQSAAEDDCLTFSLNGELSDTDGSESLSLILGTEVTSSYPGLIGSVYGGVTSCSGTPIVANGDGDYDLTPNMAKTATNLWTTKIAVALGVHSDDDVRLAAALYSTEANDGGDTSADTGNINVLVDAVADAPNFSLTSALPSQIIEDDMLSVSFDLSLVDTDGSETLSSLTFANVNGGTLDEDQLAALNLEIDTANSDSDTIVIVPMDGFEFPDSLDLDFTLAEDDDTDLTIDAILTTLESSSQFVTQTASTTIDIDVKVLAEVDGADVSGEHVDGMTIAEDACVAFDFHVDQLDATYEDLVVEVRVLDDATYPLTFDTLELYTDAACTVTVTKDEVDSLWVVPGSDPSVLYIKGPDQSDQDFKLEISVDATENSPEVQAQGAAQYNTRTTSNVFEVPVVVLAVADAAFIETNSPINVDEDNDFSIIIDVTQVDSDGSEEMQQLIAWGFPENMNPDTGDPSYTVDEEGQLVIDLSTQEPPFTVTLFPPEDFSDTFSIFVRVDSVELEPNDAQVLNRTSPSDPTTVTVVVAGVADTPSAAAADVTGDEDEAIPLVLSASLSDVDGSESFTYRITDLDGLDSSISFDLLRVECDGQNMDVDPDLEFTFMFTDQECTDLATVELFADGNANTAQGLLNLRFTATAVEGEPFSEGLEEADATDDFTVTIIPSNDAPGPADPAYVCIDENSDTEVVTTLTSPTDPDVSWEGDTHVFTLQTSTPYFTIEENAGVYTLVTTSTLLDYEDTETHPDHEIDLDILVEDAAGLQLASTITVCINDVSEAPTDIVAISDLEFTAEEEALNADMILEENSLDTRVGYLTAVDQDAASSFTYSCVDADADVTYDAGDDSYSLFGGIFYLRDGEIWTTTSDEYTTYMDANPSSTFPYYANYEEDVPEPPFTTSTDENPVDTSTIDPKGKVYDVDITVTDDTGLTFVKTIYIATRDVNEAPFWREFAPLSSNVGILYMPVTLHLFDEDSAYNNWDQSSLFMDFEVVSDDGVLSGQVDGVARAVGCSDGCDNPTKYASYSSSSLAMFRVDDYYVYNPEDATATAGYNPLQLSVRLDVADCVAGSAVIRITLTDGTGLSYSKDLDVTLTGSCN